MSETQTFEELFLSCNMEHTLAQKEIKILLVSDIKGNHMYLQKLKEWQLENAEYFDYIFVLGNMLDLPINSQNTEMTIPKSEADLSAIVTFFENINLNVIYVGGAHDPSTIFKLNKPSLTIKSINLHQSHFKIADDLYLIGQGGSIPQIASVFSPSQSQFHAVNFKQAVLTDGFPFNDPYQLNKKYIINDNNYGASLIKALLTARNDIKDNNETPNIKFIVLSHIGPFYSHTSSYKEKENVVHTGSVSMNGILSENSKDVILNIHGGNPLGKGVTKLNDVTVINPGDIDKGNFGVLILKRDEKTFQWTINQIELKSLK